MKVEISLESTSEIPNCPFASQMDELLHQSDASSISSWFEPSPTLVFPSAVQVPDSLITTPPELRLREAIPEPQADCGQLQNSADQAVRQANQQASESIRQATQQASQSADAATRSATDAIRQANQSASQSIAAASRSASQAMQSASAMVASVQASAADAVSRASTSAESAKSAQSSAQVCGSDVTPGGSAV